MIENERHWKKLHRLQINFLILFLFYPYKRTNITLSTNSVFSSNRLLVSLLSHQLYELLLSFTVGELDQSKSFENLSNTSKMNRKRNASYRNDLYLSLRGPLFSLTDSSFLFLNIYMHTKLQEIYFAQPFTLFHLIYMRF